MQGPSAGFGGQAGWPPPKPAFASFVLGLYLSLFHSLVISIMIVVGTEISSGERARASKRVAMQACTVDRFPIPYSNRTVYTV